RSSALSIPRRQAVRHSVPPATSRQVRSPYWRGNAPGPASAGHPSSMQSLQRTLGPRHACGPTGTIARRLTMMKFNSRSTLAVTALACAIGVVAGGAQAQTLTNNATGTHDGYYYAFWKDSGSASMTLHPGGRYSSQWTSNTNNWVGGKGWNPGGPRVVNYSGYYGVNNSQNSYLALYGWTRSPLIEYYAIESYGPYNPASCSGGADYGSFQSDGATYNARRCLRQKAPSIEGHNRTYYQYFSVRNPKKGFGNISGTITVANHFNYWASRGLNLGNHDYMVFATEGYQSQGSSDITISSGGSNPPPGNGGSKTIVVRARGTAGGEN